MLALLILAIASTVLAHEGHNGSDLLKIFFVKREIFFIIYLTDGHVIEWTITGEPFELCVNPGTKYETNQSKAGT